MLPLQQLMHADVEVETDAVTSSWLDKQFHAIDGAFADYEAQNIVEASRGSGGYRDAQQITGSIEMIVLTLPVGWNPEPDPMQGMLKQVRERGCRVARFIELMHFIEENPDGAPLSRDLVAFGSFIRTRVEKSEYFGKQAFSAVSATLHEEPYEIVTTGLFGRSTELSTRTVVRRRLGLRTADSFDPDDVRRRSFDLLVVKL